MDRINSGILQKLINTVEKGTGVALKPWQIRRVGKAEADVKGYELLRETQSLIDAQYIADGKKILNEDGKLIWISEQPKAGERIEPYIGNLDEIQSQMQARQYAQAMTEEINLTKIVLMAQDELLTNAKDYNTDQVDIDWFVRWRDCAQKVSNENIQQLWANLLAEEVAKPNSFSLRTLEFLKNLSQSEALLIERASCYVLSNQSIYKTNYLEEVGLTFSDIKELEDLGILSSGDLHIMQDESNTSSFNSIVYGERAVAAKKNDQVFHYAAYKVTKLGSELFKLCTVKPDYHYLNKIGEDIKKKGFSPLLYQMSIGGIELENIQVIHAF